ncbi:oxygen-insensitive NADPH nitroreductase [Anaerobacillus sp. 1_MG-2023]|uniref:oxygen-insensitive NADPH nitroreductase n=1 Tax=Bacillales TaxID=1385 RepID=UPI0026E4670E|nr:oxygen-insensitive NADPH nitroreductase [Anaerobacillus sp. 1_MG-2023]MDO6655118.1 oxygen-insensitive NADPH nitroreductase [Anaerobacillus sp. 1_MG-2023]
MNQTIETMLAHRSIRAFKDNPLTEEQIHTLVKAAQSASTSSYIQAYSIIGVEDKEKKKQLAELAGGQSYVEKNGHFFVFCADFNRHHATAEMHGTDVTETTQTTEKFMVGLIDAALAAQNASIAAESMGLGICYIGGIRNDLEKVSEVLNLPQFVIPLFGLCVGYPDQDPDVKPRLPLNNIYHIDEYEHDANAFKEGLNEYDEVISGYYTNRTGGQRSAGWTSMMAHKLATPVRTYMKKFLEKKGFPLK